MENLNKISDIYDKKIEELFQENIHLKNIIAELEKRLEKYDTIFNRLNFGS